MNQNIMIVGVGGQGSLLASKLLGHVVMQAGYDVKVSEVHGMSQRGGSVVTYVKYSDEKVWSPVINEGEADIIISFELLEAARCPVVLDADGLNAAAGGAFSLNTGGGPLILTPHPGEMARLCGLTPAQVNADRPALAARMAREWGCILVLKGHATLVAAPDGVLWANTTGNPGLARGGSGDVLAGMIGGLCAAGLPPLEAAKCGVWLHGAAADRAAARLGQWGMLPSDLPAALGELFAENSR